MPVELYYPDQLPVKAPGHLLEGNKPSTAMTLGLAPVGTFLETAEAITRIGAGLADIYGIESEALHEAAGGFRRDRHMIAPDPETTTFASQLAHGFLGMAPYLFMGPAGIGVMGTNAAIDTGVGLVEKDVDKQTAYWAAVTAGAFGTAMAALPFHATGLGKRAVALAGTPTLGMAQRGAIAAELEAAGFYKQAQGYDPFDPTAIGIDAIMGGVFAGAGIISTKRKQMAFNAEKERINEYMTRIVESPEYGEAIKELPVEYADAVDVIRSRQQAIKEAVFDPKNPAELRAHLEAFEEALNSVVKGERVSVAEKIVEALGEAKETTPEPKPDPITETVNKVIKQAEKEPIIPEEITEREDWGPGPAINKKAQIRRELIQASKKERPPADIKKLDAIATKKKTPEGKEKALDEMLAKAQERLNKDLEAIPEAKYIEDKLAQLDEDGNPQDLPGRFIKDAKGEAKFTSTREELVNLKKDYIDLAKKELYFEKIARCVRS